MPISIIWTDKSAIFRFPGREFQLLDPAGGKFGVAGWRMVLLNPAGGHPSTQTILDCHLELYSGSRHCGRDLPVIAGVTFPSLRALTRNLID